jgi:hypothetical protein
VQGDTTTTLCGALAAFYAGIPVAHVEAGLRTHDMRQPFPEEMNRVLASHLTDLHFAATEMGRREPAREGVARVRFTSRGTPESTPCCTCATLWNAATLKGASGPPGRFKEAHRRDRASPGKFWRRI